MYISIMISAYGPYNQANADISSERDHFWATLQIENAMILKKQSKT